MSLLLLHSVYANYLVCNISKNNLLTTLYFSILFLIFATTIFRNDKIKDLFNCVIIYVIFSFTFK